MKHINIIILEQSITIDCKNDEAVKEQIRAFLELQKDIELIYLPNGSIMIGAVKVVLYHILLQLSYKYLIALI